MNRRGFLKSILAAGVAPYVVTTAGVLMPVRQIARLEDFSGPWGVLYPYTEPIDAKQFFGQGIVPRQITLKRSACKTSSSSAY